MTITAGDAPPVFGPPIDIKVSELARPTVPTCTECGQPATLQVTSAARASLSLKLPDAQPRCSVHGQLLPLN